MGDTSSSTSSVVRSAAGADELERAVLADIGWARTHLDQIAHVVAELAGRDDLTAVQAAQLSELEARYTHVGQLVVDAARFLRRRRGLTDAEVAARRAELGVLPKSVVELRSLVAGGLPGLGRRR